MIPIYNIEELTLEMIDELVERGVVFDITSKTSVLSKSRSDDAYNSVWRSRNKRTDDLQQTSEW